MINLQLNEIRIFYGIRKYKLSKNKKCFTYMIHGYTCDLCGSNEFTNSCKHRINMNKIIFDNDNTIKRKKHKL